MYINLIFLKEESQEMNTFMHLNACRFQHQNHSHQEEMRNLSGHRKPNKDCIHTIVDNDKKIYQNL